MSAGVKAGDRVRLHPHGGGDVFDLALDGKTATVESVEHDFEGREHVSVVLDDDPGQDFGMMRQPGHRFFFGTDEVEPAGPGNEILIAGIGNIFLGDDAFGVEVAKLLATRSLPDGVRVADFGIRGFDLAYALAAYKAAILVDTCQRGSEPGTLYVIDPGDEPLSAAVETHGMNPSNVLRLAKELGAVPKQILVVGCEPATLGAESDGEFGLSDPVAAALNPAADLVESLVQKLRAVPYA
jgi:hydrogenase maturation protease